MVLKRIFSWADLTIGFVSLQIQWQTVFLSERSDLVIGAAILGKSIAMAG